MNHNTTRSFANCENAGVHRTNCNRFNRKLTEIFGKITTKQTLNFDNLEQLTAFLALVAAINSPCVLPILTLLISSTSLYLRPFVRIFSHLKALISSIRTFVFVLSHVIMIIAERASPPQWFLYRSPPSYFNISQSAARKINISCKENQHQPISCKENQHQPIGHKKLNISQLAARKSTSCNKIHYKL